MSRQPTATLKEPYKDLYLMQNNWHNHVADFNVALGDRLNQVTQEEYDALFIFFMAGILSMIDVNSNINANFVDIGEPEKKIITEVNEATNVRPLTDGACR